MNTGGIHKKQEVLEFNDKVVIITPTARLRPYSAGINVWSIPVVLHVP